MGLSEVAPVIVIETAVVNWAKAAMCMAIIQSHEKLTPPRHRMHNRYPHHPHYRLREAATTKEETHV